MSCRAYIVRNSTFYARSHFAASSISFPARLVPPSCVAHKLETDELPGADPQAAELYLDYKRATAGIGRASRSRARANYMYSRAIYTRAESRARVFIRRKNDRELFSFSRRLLDADDETDITVR